MLFPPDSIAEILDSFAFDYYDRERITQYGCDR